VVAVEVTDRYRRRCRRDHEIRRRAEAAGAGTQEDRYRAGVAVGDGEIEGAVTVEIRHRHGLRIQTDIEIRRRAEAQHPTANRVRNARRQRDQR